jgi:signal transduction histidine kinase/CheY-like chemotaxis protein
VTFVPHLGGEGQRLGLFTLMQEVTERRRADAAIKEANETLERRVAERTAALTDLNAKLQREVAERRQVEKALQIAKSEAEQANLSKTRFLAAASHDLLQPLNAARLFVSALADLDHAKRDGGLIDSIDMSLGAVEDLLGALLDISKLDAGAISPEISDFPIAGMLGPLIVEHMVLASARGLDIRYLPSRAVVSSDPRLLRSIVQNFLSNAIRYTRTGGILLGCRQRGRTLRIEVWDTGPGIPADKLDEIFEEFRQLHKTGDGREPGIGLGLAIVRRAAKMLNLPIGTRSVVGRGSVFSVTVPLGLKPRALVHRGLSPGALAPAVREQLVGAVLLVIDDQRSILAGMEALLSGWGCKVLVAASGDEALAMLPQLPAPPAAVIADYHLEAGSVGIAEIERVRQALARPIPAIVITADHGAAVQAMVKQHGHWLLKKPVNPAQLRSLLTQILAR